MAEQTLSVNVSVQKDKKKNIRKAGKTLLIKPNDGIEIDESWFSDLVGIVSTSKTAKTGSYFLTFDKTVNVNINFNNDICYKGLYHLNDSIVNKVKLSKTN